MGNHSGRQDGHGTTASPLDFFHTPPTTPSEAQLAAMALSPAASSNKAQTAASPPAGGGGGGGGRTTPTPPSTASPIAPGRAQKASPPAEWAVISVDGGGAACPEEAGGERPGGAGGPAPAEQSWQEQDSGVEPQAGEEMSLALLSLTEHHRAPPGGLSPNTDVTTGAVELLRRLLTEKDELVEEVNTLQETLRTERSEWHQFQSDLQVAVSVADRLRLEAEQALGSLRERHRAAEAQLAQALEAQQETLRELDVLRAQHRDARRQLTEASAELAALRAKRAKHPTESDGHAERQDSEEGRGQGEGEGQGEETQEDIEEKPREDDAGSEAEKPTEEAEASEGADGTAVDRNPEEADGSGPTQLTGKGVAEGYLRSLAALEKKKDVGWRQRDPRKIAMLSERSWSLSRLPLPTDPSSENGPPKNTSTTLPLCKKEEPPKRRRVDRVLQRQDSWSSFYTGKQDEDQSSDPAKPQDGFSALLRRHGGSRRNSLLRWCQSRTHGYKNIEITNFSSSWEDGLAFCAIYHTYLPTHVPYDSLSPADKKENLALAFKTGEGVGIAATLAAEEMLKADGPDWQKVLSYVESIFRHFEM